MKGAWHALKAICCSRDVRRGGKRVREYVQGREKREGPLVGFEMGVILITLLDVSYGTALFSFPHLSGRSKIHPSDLLSAPLL